MNTYQNNVATGQMGNQAYGQETENLNEAAASVHQGHRQSSSALWKDKTRQQKK